MLTSVLCWSCNPFCKIARIASVCRSMMRFGHPAKTRNAGSRVWTSVLLAMANTWDGRGLMEKRVEQDVFEGDDSRRGELVVKHEAVRRWWAEEETAEEDEGEGAHLGARSDACGQGDEKNSRVRSRRRWQTAQSRANTAPGSARGGR